LRFLTPCSARLVGAIREFPSFNWLGILPFFFEVYPQN